MGETVTVAPLPAAPQLYVIVPVPPAPLAVSVAEPPLQNDEGEAVAVTVGGLLPATVALAVAVQLLASVTVTV